MLRGPGGFDSELCRWQRVAGVGKGLSCACCVNGVLFRGLWITSPALATHSWPPVLSQPRLLASPVKHDCSECYTGHCCKTDARHRFKQQTDHSVRGKTPHSAVPCVPSAEVHLVSFVGWGEGGRLIPAHTQDNISGLPCTFCLQQQH